MQADIRDFLTLHPSVSALATELRFALNGDSWIVGAGEGIRAFGKTPLSALEAFAKHFLPRRL